MNSICDIIGCGPRRGIFWHLINSILNHAINSNANEDCLHSHYIRYLTWKSTSRPRRTQVER